MMKTKKDNTVGIKQNKPSLLIVLVCVLGLVIGSCSDSSTGTNGGDNGNGGDDNGNTEIGTEPTFTNVQQIFNQSCGGSGCHIGNTTSGVRLDSYDNVTGSQGSQYGELVVQPGDADGSPLVDKIEANPTEGSRMPVGGPYLSDDRIAQIKEWIDNGAEND